MARGINKVILVGNLGADPEVRYMPTGGAAANFTVATSESWTDKQTNEKKESTEWHRCVVYQRLAEIVGEYARKGSKVYVEGKLKTRKWQDQQGIERYTTEVIADTVQLLDGRGDGAAPAQNQAQTQQPQGGYQQQQRPMNQQAAAQQQRPVQQPQGNYHANGSALPNTYQPPQQAFNQPQQGAFNQPQGGQQRGPMEPPIDFDDDIPF